MSESTIILGRLVDSDSPDVSLVPLRNISSVQKVAAGYHVTIGVDAQTGFRLLQWLMRSDVCPYYGGLVLMDSFAYESEAKKLRKEAALLETPTSFVESEKNCD